MPRPASYVPTVRLEEETFTEMYTPTHGDPHRLLWAACLEEAVNCIHGIVVGNTKGSKNKHKAMRDARAWFRNNETEPGTFLWGCAVLGLDPETVRQDLAHKIY